MNENIVDVTELDFHYNVLEYSYQSPVVVDFWAEWCKPCKVLTVILENLANETPGSFRLAKINIDQNSNLTIRMGVLNIPHIKGIKNSQVVSELVGIQPESRLREFVSDLTPKPSGLWIEKGDHFLEIEDWKEAERAYRQAIEIQPQNTQALLGLAKVLIRQHNLKEAHQILREFPVSKEYPSAERILNLVNALITWKDVSAITDNDLEAAYARGMKLLSIGNYYAALDGFLEIMRTNKEFRRGQLKPIFLGVLEVLGDKDPATRSYRQELATILF